MSNQGRNRVFRSMLMGVLILVSVAVLLNATVFGATANTVIQAQNWSAKNGSVASQSGVAPDGTSIGSIAAGDWVRYNGIDFGTGGYNTFMATVAVDSTNAGRNIEIRLDSSTGTSIGALTVASTGSMSIFKEQYVTISNVTGVHDVYLVFPSASPANIDWFVFSKYNGSESTAERDQRMQWWREARFGQFIHWGGYSHLAGVFRGTTTGGLGEWIMNDLGISRANYESDATSLLNPTSFNAQQWVSVCKNAGQKYMVITSKHHEGFSMFDTAVTGFKGESSSTIYSIVRFGPYGQDPIAALAQECKSQGVKFCFYYSIMDWHHSSQSGYGSTMLSGQKDSYVMQMKEQLMELVTKYDPEVLWFDGEWQGWWTTADGQALYRYLRTMKPSLIVNNRVGKRAQTDGDFGTPEQEIPPTGLSYDWETCMTINNTWGFKSNDTSWKSTGTLIKNLADTSSKGGNYLLNIGPTGLGVIPQASIDRLTQMGQWLGVYGESIYATKASCFSDIPSWGCYTTKTGKLYVHVITWPGNNQLTIPKLTNTINKVYLLNDPGTNLSYTTAGNDMVITVPTVAPNQYDSVVVVDIVGDPGTLPPVRSLVYNNPATVSNYYQNNVTYNGAKAVDEVSATRWATDDNITSAWLEVDFGASTTFNKTVTKECIDYGQRVAGYKIQYWNGSSWVDAYTGTTIGSAKTDTFAAVTGTKVRLNITSVTGAFGPTIWEFMVYNEGGATPTPTPTLTPTPTPTALPTPVPGNGTGLSGEYYDNMDLTNLKVTRTDATVNFDWGTGSPDALIGVDTFSARWTGQVQAKYTETYTFYTNSDDGIRLWVNNQQLVNNWTDHGPTENSGTISLTAGQKYDLKLEFYENGGGAVAMLSWSSASQVKEIIPQTQLYPATGPTPTPAPTATPTPAMINDNAAGITYSGTWTYHINRGYGDYNNDVHATLTNNDFLEYTFTGTGVDYITEKYNDEGDVDVYIDGVFQQTVSCYNASTRLVQQVVYSKTGLTNGSHTIKVVKKTGQYALLDVFKIYQ
jgi:alpha-L-fucosidase